MLLIKLHDADLQWQQQQQHDSSLSTAVLFDSCYPGPSAVTVAGTADSCCVDLDLLLHDIGGAGGLQSAPRTTPPPHSAVHRTDQQTCLCRHCARYQFTLLDKPDVNQQ